MYPQLSGSNVPEPSNRIDQILNNAADVLERTCVLERRLMQLAERLLGTNVYPAEKDKEPPCGSVNRVLYTIDTINNRLDGVFAELERLEHL